MGKAECAADQVEVVTILLFGPAQQMETCAYFDSQSTCQAAHCVWGSSCNEAPTPIPTPAPTPIPTRTFASFRVFGTIALEVENANEFCADAKAWRAVDGAISSELNVDESRSKIAGCNPARRLSSTYLRRLIGNAEINYEVQSDTILDAWAIMGATRNLNKSMLLTEINTRLKAEGIELRAQSVSDVSNPFVDFAL